MPANSAEPAGRPIVIVGVERSGTSMLANMVSKWGAYGGDIGYLGRKDTWNAYGTWEHPAPIQLITLLLDRVGPRYWEPSYSEVLRELASDPRLRAQALACIAEVSAGRSLWFMKEPLCSVQLAFWKQFLPNAIYLVTVRNPSDSAMSLMTRNLPPELAGVTTRAYNLLRWQVFYSSILKDTIDVGSVRFVEYERVTAAPEAEAARLCEFLCRECGLPPEDRAARMAAVVKPEERRFRSVSFEDEPLATAEQKALYTFVRRKVDDPALPFVAADYPLHPGYEEYFNNIEWVRKHVVPTLMSMRAYPVRIGLAIDRRVRTVYNQAFLLKRQLARLTERPSGVSSRDPSAS
jgi:hypothetical protein